MNLQFGEIFEKLGIPGKGHLGATWCDLNPDGVMVLVAHQKYFHRRSGGWVYETPDNGPLPIRASSAARSLSMLADYFQPDRAIILAVAEFYFDGGKGADGEWLPSQFKAATGDAYEGRMRAFDQGTGYLLCNLDRRFSVR